MWNLFKIRNEDTRTMAVASFVVHGALFKLSSNYWLWTGKRLLGSYWKDKHFWRQDPVYHAFCHSNLSVTKIYLVWPAESVRNFCERDYFRRWFWLKRWCSHSRWPAAHLYFYELLFIDFARWKTNLILFDTIDIEGKSTLKLNSSAYKKYNMDIWVVSTSY